MFETIIDFFRNVFLEDDSMARMRGYLDDGDFGQGQFIQKCQDGYPVYDTDPYLTCYPVLEEILSKVGLRYGNEDYLEGAPFSEIQSAGRALQKEYILAAFRLLLWNRVDHQLKSNFHIGLTSISYRARALLVLINRLIRKKQPFSQADYLFIFKSISHRFYGHMYLHISYLLNQLEKDYADRILPNEIQKELRCILKSNFLVEREKAKIGRILQITSPTSSDKPRSKPFFALKGDLLGKSINQSIKQLGTEEQDAYYDLLRKCKNATAGAPSNRFLSSTSKLIHKISPELFVEFYERHVDLLTDLVSKDTNQNKINWIGSENATIWKGLTWAVSGFLHHGLIQKLEQLSFLTYTQLGGRSGSQAIGNACIFALGQDKELNGVKSMSRLRQQIRHTHLQSRIEAMLIKTAERMGISQYELEEIAVDDHGLQSGVRAFQLDEYTAELKILGIGKTHLTWLRPDGKRQKSAPANIKTKYPERLKKISLITKSLKKDLTLQRNRIDRMFIADRSWTFKYFCQYYHNHGLVSQISRKLIWEFKLDEEWISVFFKDDTWIDIEGKVVQIPSDDMLVRLWHPAMHDTEVVQNWRAFMQRHEITQPMKQAYREVYWLTDAERHTDTYSNRMAAHLLKQHQMGMLAKGRGWRYQLMGAYDDGIHATKVEILLPAHQLKAQFWVNEVDLDDQMNDYGIWLYVATDQLRFLPILNDEPIPLEEVPIIAFSEIMRDVDLFVGVASVGNDPTWQDSGGQVAENYRDYWHSYSFGELSEMAKVRVDVLKNMVPRLKIADQCHFDQRFLVVKGHLRTYKIHMGSGNILMEPNDQYLCIVPDVKHNQKSTNKLFLPFEGDRILSIILSKAFMLAADDQIKDKTITRQIKVG